jgi:hypothetical protein
MIDTYSPSFRWVERTVRNSEKVNIDQYFPIFLVK